jgi:CheY-like chemotaxis protein
MKGTELTVLLVEDHADTRQAVAGWLKHKGYAVVEAHNVEIALAAAQAQAFDILLCDLQLPDGDGWTLMRDLCAKRPIIGIATSGHCSAADLARSKEAGFSEHVIKPYSTQQIDRVFQQAEAAVKARKARRGNIRSKVRRRRNSGR